MPPIHLNEGQTVENVTLSWTEGAVLEGKVLTKIRMNLSQAPQ